MEKDRKLNWRQACSILGCGKTKFYEFISSGRLPATRSGQRGIRVLESDVLRMVEHVVPLRVDEQSNAGSCDVG